MVNFRKPVNFMHDDTPGEDGCKLRRWSLLVPTSMGLRRTPLDGLPVHLSEFEFKQATSAESNVATPVSYLGMPAKVLTAFVEGSPDGQFIKDSLRRRHLNFEGREFKQCGPWGYTHQTNIADRGSGSRGPRVWNNRAGEVGRALMSHHFDLDRIFGKEGVTMLHFSGLIAALPFEKGNFALDVARVAKKYGTHISFDLNYRASFWKGREQELKSVFEEIASIADILIGNEEDYQYCLGIEGPETGGKKIATKTKGFKEMIENAKKAFPNVSVFANTLREVKDANRHLWNAILYANKEWYVGGQRFITVVDRIGGGDGFVAGLLYGLLKDWDPRKCLRFGLGMGSLATTTLYDYAQPADEQEVFDACDGNARVKR